MNSFDKLTNIINKANDKTLEGFLLYMSKESATTQRNYLYSVSKFIDYLGKDPREITITDVMGYLNYIRYDKEGKEKTSSYMISVYSAIKKYFTFLVADDIIQSSPVDRIPRPKSVESMETYKKRQIGYLSKDEMVSYVSNIKEANKGSTWGTRDELMILLFLTTGMRKTALININIQDIDFANRTLTITDKGSKIHTYVLTDQVMDVLAMWMDKRDSIMEGYSPTPALFISKKRNRISPDAALEVVKKYANIEGKHITPHKLRATYGTMLYNETHDIYFVQKQMGHSSPKTTELYIRGEDSGAGIAANIMQKAL